MKRIEERRPGRPEIGPAVQVRLPEDLLEQIDALAEQAGISRAETIRQLLEKALFCDIPVLPRPPKVK